MMLCDLLCGFLWNIYRLLKLYLDGMANADKCWALRWVEVNPQ